MLIVQIIALRQDAMSAFRKVQFWKIGTALVAGCLASVWVANLRLRSLFALVVSACLFFAAYGGVLLVLREQLLWEILGQMLGKLRKK